MQLLLSFAHVKPMSERLSNLVLRLGWNVVVKVLFRSSGPSTRCLGSVKRDLGVIVCFRTAAANVLNAGSFEYFLNRDAFRGIWVQHLQHQSFDRWGLDEAEKLAALWVAVDTIEDITIWVTLQP